MPLNAEPVQALFLPRMLSEPERAGNSVSVEGGRYPHPHEMRGKKSI